MSVLKNTRLLLIIILAASVFFPSPPAVKGQVGTAVEINSGNTITLKPGETRPGSGNKGIAVAVKNLPNMGAPANGLAVFELTLTWNKDVIRVDTISPATDAGGWSIIPGDPRSTPGTVKCAGFTTTYSTSDVVLMYFGISATGKANDTATLGLTINILGDKDVKPIAATAVNAPVKITAAKLVSVAITPLEALVPAGSTKQFFATGNYDDDTSADVTGTVAWTSSSPSIATVMTGAVTDPGLASSLAEGTTTIRAAQGTLSSSAVLTVTKAEQPANPPPSPPAQQTPAIPAPPVTQTQPSQINQPPATLSPVENPTSSPSEPGSAPEPGGVAPVPPPPSSSGFSFNFSPVQIGVIAGGVLVLGAAIFMLLRRRAMY